MATVTITDENDIAAYRRTLELRLQIAVLEEELSDLETTQAAKLGKLDKWAIVPGLGKFERYRTSPKVTWEDDSLRARIIQAARGRVADENGEIIEDPVERTVYVINKAASLDWRVGKADDKSKPGLATFGIEADQYREKEQGILKVRFHSLLTEVSS